MRTKWYVLVAGALVIAALAINATWWHALVVIMFIALDARRRAEHERHYIPAEDAYRAGYDMGYDEGWREGRTHGRPTVVPFPSNRASGDSVEMNS